MKQAAGRTGLEPAASCVTGIRSFQLNYRPTFVNFWAEYPGKTTEISHSNGTSPSWHLGELKGTGAILFGTPFAQPSILYSG